MLFCGILGSGDPLFTGDPPNEMWRFKILIKKEDTKTERSGGKSILRGGDTHAQVRAMNGRMDCGPKGRILEF